MKRCSHIWVRCSHFREVYIQAKPTGGKMIKKVGGVGGEGGGTKDKGHLNIEQRDTRGWTKSGCSPSLSIQGVWSMEYDCMGECYRLPHPGAPSTEPFSDAWDIRKWLIFAKVIKGHIYFQCKMLGGGGACNNSSSWYQTQKGSLGECSVL